MSQIRLVLHGIDDDSVNDLAGAQIIARTSQRGELHRVVSTLQPHVLVIDLDAEDALDAIVAARELDLKLGIVGVSGQSDGRTMIAALRAGCRQLSPKPLDINDLAIAIRRVAAESGVQRDSGRVVSVIGAIGGAGSTTISCYLAKGLAELTRQRALLLDYDFDFGNVARAWDLTASHTVADIASAGAVDMQMIDKAAIASDDLVAVIARPNTVAEGHTIDENSAAALIKAARSGYPYSVIDLPRKLDAVTGGAIELSDTLLIVIQLSVPAVDNARRLVDALSQFGFPSGRIELVVNRFRKNVHTVSVEMVEKQFKKKVLAIVPNDYAAIASAVDLGTPVTTKSPARTAITDLAASLIGRKIEAAPTGWRSLFRLGRAEAAAAK